MKKVLAMLLASSMILSFVACGNNETNETTEATTEVTTEATTEIAAEETTTANEEVVAPAETGSLDLLREIWNAYLADETIAEENKLTFVGGGDYNWMTVAAAEFEANNPMPADDASDEVWEAYWMAYSAATQGPGNVVVEYTEENTYLASISFPVDKIDLIDCAASVFHGMMLNNFTGAVYHVADSANVATVAEALKASIASTQWVCGQPEVYTIITVGDFIVAIYGLDMIATDLTNVIEGLYDNAIVVCKEAVM